MDKTQNGKGINDYEITGNIEWKNKLMNGGIGGDEYD